MAKLPYSISVPSRIHRRLACRPIPPPGHRIDANLDPLRITDASQRQQPIAASVVNEHRANPKEIRDYTLLHRYLTNVGQRDPLNLAPRIVIPHRNAIPCKLVVRPMPK
jgi:hypothetical protein